MPLIELVGKSHDSGFCCYGEGSVLSLYGLLHFNETQTSFMKARKGLFFKIEGFVLINMSSEADCLQE